jgi:hypothetical protein
MVEKKLNFPNCLDYYLPSNIIEFIQDTVVPNVLSDEEVSETSVDNDSDSQISSSFSCVMICR